MLYRLQEFGSGLVMNLGEGGLYDCETEHCMFDFVALIVTQAEVGCLIIVTYELQPDSFNGCDVGCYALAHLPPHHAHFCSGREACSRHCMAFAYNRVL